MRSELKTFGIYVIGFISIGIFLGFINEVRKEYVFGSFALFAFLMIFLTIYLFYSSRLKHDTIFPPRQRLI